MRVKCTKCNNKLIGTNGKNNIFTLNKTYYINEKEPRNIVGKIYYEILDNYDNIFFVNKNNNIFKFQWCDTIEFIEITREEKLNRILNLE
jgi:hypothetical protein